MRKKLLAFLGTTVLTLACSVTAFAGGGDKIKSISGPIDTSEVVENGQTDSNGNAQFDPAYSEENPYLGLDTSNGITVEFDIENIEQVKILSGILSFYNDGYSQLLYFTSGSYLGANTGDGYFDANMSNYALVKDWLGNNGGHVQIVILPKQFAVYLDGVKCYDQTVLDDKSTGSQENYDGDYSSVLKWLSTTCTKVGIGGGTWWRAIGFDELNATVSNVDFYLGDNVGISASGSNSSSDDSAATGTSKKSDEKKKSAFSPVVIIGFVVAIVIIVVIVIFGTVLKNKSKVAPLDDDDNN